jgi:membrane protein YqaA with SNARE-associated domain
MLGKFVSRAKASPRYEAFISSKPLLLMVSLFDWPRRQIRRLYQWVTGWAQTRQATKALAAVAFAESSFFPIPPDPLLITMTTVYPHKYLRFAAICTAGSILGGIFGYLLGVGLFETIGQPIINAYHLQSEFVALGRRYDENAFLTVFTAAFTPIPYKLITIAAGVFKVSFFDFVIASILGRGTRFFLVASLMHHFGKRYKDKIEQYIDLLSLAFVALLILGVMALKYI